MNGIKKRTQTLMFYFFLNGILKEVRTLNLRHASVIYFIKIIYSYNVQYRLKIYHSLYICICYFTENWLKRVLVNFPAYFTHSKFRVYAKFEKNVLNCASKYDITNSVCIMLQEHTQIC